MNIIIDKTLRDLRGKRGNTQEDLAEYLSVSPQAVSRWERGETMPDITFLPQIAAFYDVTVDELLGVGEMRKQEKIEGYRAEYAKLNHECRFRDAVDVMRLAVHEFPNEHGLITLLCRALVAADPSEDEVREVIALCDKVLNESTDSDIRALTIENKCFAYRYLGDLENGRRCAMTATGVWQSCNALLPPFLDGKEFTDCCQSNILDFTDLLCTQADWLTRKEQSNARKIEIGEGILKVMNAVFDDGNYRLFASGVCRTHRRLAEWYAAEGNEEQVKKHLEDAARCAVENDGLPEPVVFTSTLLKGYETDTSDMAVGQRDSASHLLERLEDELFTQYRTRDWFIAIEDRLKSQK